MYVGEVYLISHTFASHVINFVLKNSRISDWSQNYNIEPVYIGQILQGRTY